MTSSTAFILDNNLARTEQLREQLAVADVESSNVQSISEITTSPLALFIAGDDPMLSCSDEMVTKFAQKFPRVPVVVVNERPMWEVVTVAVQHGAWMDIPKSDRYDDLLARYISSRAPRPEIIIEGSSSVCERLLTEWHESPHYETDLRLIYSVGESLQAVVDGQVPVLLNLTPPVSTRQNHGSSTLIYSLCPAVIAAIVEAFHIQPKYQNYITTKPVSRFAVLKPPFRSSEIKSLLTSMDVVWPVTSPL